MTLTDPSSAPADRAAADEIDIDALIAGFRRRAGLFAGVAAVVALIVLAVLLGRPPAYTAAASLQINTRKAQVVAGPAVLSALDAEAAIVDTEVEVLRSPQLAAAVVDDLGLTRDPAFNPALRPTLLARLNGRVPPAPDPAVARQRVIAAVGRRLTVRRVGLT